MNAAADFAFAAAFMVAYCAAALVLVLVAGSLWLLLHDHCRKVTRRPGPLPLYDQENERFFPDRRIAP